MMMINQLTDDQLGAAAYLIETARHQLADSNPHVGTWDRPGIAGQLRTTLGGHTLTDALTVALTAASDPDAATPAAFSWQKYRQQPSKAGTGSTSTRPVKRVTCQVCSRTETACQQAQRNTGTDWHAFEPVGGA